MHAASSATLRRALPFLSLCSLVLTAPLCARAQGKPKPEKTEKVVVEGKPEASPAPPVQESSTDHTITVGGKTIAYTAVAGTLTVGYSDTFDAMLSIDGKLLPGSGMNPPDPAKPEDAPATARMFYTAYFKKPEPGTARPVMFLYNGGPGLCHHVAPHGLLRPAPRHHARY